MPRVFVIELSLLLVVRAQGHEAIVDAPFWQEFREPFLTGSEARQNDVYALALDGHGSLWLATRAGLFIVRDAQWERAAGTDPAGPVFSLICDRAGTVWVGAWNGLYRATGQALDRIDGTSGPIGVLAVCDQGLLAGGPEGVWLRRNDQWEQLHGDWATSVRDLTMIGDVLWVATSVELYRVEDGTTRKFFDVEHLCSRDCRALAVASDGKLWVGTGDGIDVFDGTHHVSRYQEGDQAPPAREVRSLTFDAEGRLWAATSLGVARFDGKQWTLRHSERWLPSNDVRRIVVDDRNEARVATAAGVAHLRRKRMTLADKAAHYESIVRARHVREPGLVEKCVLTRRGDLSDWEPTDTDNDGQYTGTYLVAESYRFAATGAADAQANARAAYDAMEFLQTVTDTPGFIARTAVPSSWTRMADPNHIHAPQEIAEHLVEDPRDKPVDIRWRKSRDGKWLWKGDTSSDEITGHFYAYGVYYDLAADDSEKERVRRHVRRVMDYIIEGGFELLDTDGKPTRWGIWSPRRLNHDPNWQLDRGVNSVEILSYLATAFHITGDDKYRQAAQRLYEDHEYSQNVLLAQMTDPGAFTYIDSELLGMAYRGLFAYDREPSRRSGYRQSIDRWFAANRRDHSPMYNFVFAEATGELQGVRECVDYLRDVPLDMIQWTIDNSGRNDVRLVRKPYADAWQVDCVLPASERAILKWDANPYRAVDGEDGRTESPAASWLFPYWIGRYLGLISGPQAE